MIGFLRRRNHDRLRTLLSSYIDGEVSDAESTQVENHLATCEDCRLELESLRSTVSLLNGLPELAIPRSFVLAEAPRPVRPASPLVWSTRLATSAVALLLFALVLGDALGFVTQSSMPIQQFTEFSTPAPAIAPAAQSQRDEASAPLRTSPTVPAVAALAPAAPAPPAPSAQPMAAAPAPAAPVQPEPTSEIQPAAAAAPFQAARSLPESPGNPGEPAPAAGITQAQGAAVPTSVPEPAQQAPEVPMQAMAVAESSPPGAQEAAPEPFAALTDKDSTTDASATPTTIEEDASQNVGQEIQGASVESPQAGSPENLGNFGLQMEALTSTPAIDTSIEVQATPSAEESSTAGEDQTSSVLTGNRMAEDAPIGTASDVRLVPASDPQGFSLPLWQLQAASGAALIVLLSLSLVIARKNRLWPFGR